MSHRISAVVLRGQFRYFLATGPGERAGQRFNERTRDRGSLRRALSCEVSEARYCLSAIAFESHTVECCSNDSIRSVHAADLDSDGNLDLLFASTDAFHGRAKVAWYRNGDGQGDFENHQVITSQMGMASDAYAADLDGDGDLNVISALTNGIVWFENQDGHGDFDESFVITRSVSDPRAVHAADIDGDGDLDVVSASAADHKVAWYENTDGRGTFGIQRVITNRAGGVHDIDVADLDGDGDEDIVAVYAADGKIVWHENRLLGDSNDDRRFNSSDLVQVFGAGEYEDDIANNSTYDEGDWNQDGDFDSSDLVVAFQSGNYVVAARPLKSQIAAAVDWLFTHDEDVRKRRAFVA